MGHIITIGDESKDSTLSKMTSYAGPEAYSDRSCSPRVTNRQLKYFFSRLQASILASLLGKLRKTLSTSYSLDRWVAAFITVICLVLTSEEQEMMICMQATTRSAIGEINKRVAHVEAWEACTILEKQFGLVQLMFMRKCSKYVTPLHDADRDVMAGVNAGNCILVGFLRGVVGLVWANGESLRQLNIVMHKIIIIVVDFLGNRRDAEMSPSDIPGFGSRLVARLLLSFCKYQQPSKFVNHDCSLPSIHRANRRRCRGR